MISFDEFLKQDEADKYNMLQECNVIIQQKENIIKEVRKYIMTTSLDIYNYYKQDYINELITEYNDKLLDILGSDSK